MIDNRIQTVLIGRRKPLSIRYLGVAIGLFVATAGALTLQEFVEQQNGSVPIEVYWLMGALIVLMTSIPALQAYQNSGLLVSWALSTAIPLGLYVNLLPYHLGSGIGTSRGGVGAALLYGIPAGTIGFVLGAGARRVKRWIRSRLGDT